MVKMRTVIIVAGLIIGMLSIHAWAFNDNGMSTAQSMGQWIFDGEYYLTAPENVMNNSYCGWENHDVSVYGGKVAWAEEWDGDPHHYYQSHIVIYDLETGGCQYVNYSPDISYPLPNYGNLYKPILTNEYVLFYLEITGDFPANYLVIHSLDGIGAENDIGNEMWSSGLYQPNRNDVYDANNDYLVWIQANGGLASLCMSNMTMTTYPIEINYGYAHAPSITEDNVAYYTATSGEDIRNYHIDAMDLETGDITQITPQTIYGYDTYGTAYDNALWWQNATTQTDWDIKFDAQLLDVDTQEVIFDTDVDRFNYTTDLDGEWAYTMAMYNEMGIYAQEESFNEMWDWAQNLTLVNFETGEEYVLETFNDTNSFYDIYWTGITPIRNQMMWQFDNGTYVIATEGGVGVVNIQYLIPLDTEEGANLVNTHNAIIEQQEGEQEEIEARDYTLFLFGSFTLLATVVYAIWTIREIYYEER